MNLCGISMSDTVSQTPKLLIVLLFRCQRAGLIQSLVFIETDLVDNISSQCTKIRSHLKFCCCVLSTRGLTIDNILVKKCKMCAFRHLLVILPYKLRACSHDPGTVNYPGVMLSPGQALPRVHMMICCPGATLPRVNFIAPGQVHRHLITTTLSEFL